MQPSVRSGFESVNDGIQFWYFDSDGVANFIGPVAFLEPFSKGEWILQTSSGKRFRLNISWEQAADFRRRGGTIRSVKESPPPIGQAVTTGSVVQSPLIAHARNGNAVATAGQNPNRQHLQWRGVGKSVKFGPYEIADPLTYFCKSEPSEAEASCINVMLPVGSPVVEQRGALGYWPEYRRISQRQRANYLTWLAGDRKSPLDDIGYAFIYFYGLERRVLLEKQDINPVTMEVVRLLDCYTFSGSFTGYLSRFLAYVVARTGLEKLRQEWFDQIFDGRSIEPNEDILALALAWHVKKAQPLNAKWAMRMAREHPRATRSIVVKRVPQQFEALFAKKYQAEHGNGMTLRAAQRDRIVDYRQPASPSLVAIRERLAEAAPPIAIPNVLGLQSQFMPLVKIWEECISELRKLSKALPNSDNGTLTREAYEALPDILKPEYEHPEKSKWDSLVEELAGNDGSVIVPIGRLAEFREIAHRHGLTAGQSEAIARTAQEVGYCIEPDFRLTSRNYRWDDVVSLFRANLEEGSTPAPRYLAASLVLELGFAVAAADGVITENESTGISRFLEGRFELDQAETERLKRLHNVFLARHPSLSGIGKRLMDKLATAERETVGRYLVGVAAADGTINAATMKSLRAGYRAIGLSTEHLEKVLETLDRSRMGAISSDSTTTSAAANEPEYTFQLNADDVERITKDDKKLLLELTKP